MRLERVAEWSIAIHDVVVAAPVTPLVDVASLLELAQDPLDGALSDPDRA